jgi:16S rRNA (cytosine967-C5)-methyltransferase
MQPASLIGHIQEIFGIIEGSDHPADSLIDNFFRARRYLGSKDRRFIAENTYGLLRNLRKCEYILDKSSAEISWKIDEKDRRLMLVLINLSIGNQGRRISADLIPEGVKTGIPEKILFLLLEKLTAVTDFPEEPPVARIGIKYSFPDWMVKKFINQYGMEETECICAALNETAPLTLRVNTLKTNLEECRAELLKEGVETARTGFSPVGLNFLKRMNAFSIKSFREGWFEVQDEGSQLIPVVVDPKPNSKLLDVCAGAGGKTLEFSALMKNRGEIFAADINSYRLGELRKRAKRAGAQNIRVLEMDSVEDLSARFAGFFDVVFIDAPCSGIGTIRRNPGMKWSVTEKTVREVAQKQEFILRSSASLVKPGGRLVYATCTLFREENQNIVEGFLKLDPEFSLVDAAVAGQAKKIKFTDPPFFVLHPHIHGTDGFFCAVMKRNA